MVRLINFYFVTEISDSTIENNFNSHLKLYLHEKSDKENLILKHENGDFLSKKNLRSFVYHKLLIIKIFSCLLISDNSIMKVEIFHLDHFRCS